MCTLHHRGTDLRRPEIRGKGALLIITPYVLLAPICGGGPSLAEDKPRSNTCNCTAMDRTFGVHLAPPGHHTPAEVPAPMCVVPYAGRAHFAAPDHL